MEEIWLPQCPSLPPLLTHLLHCIPVGQTLAAVWFGLCALCETLVLVQMMGDWQVIGMEGEGGGVFIPLCGLEVAEPKGFLLWSGSISQAHTCPGLCSLPYPKFPLLLVPGISSLVGFYYEICLLLLVLQLLLWMSHLFPSARSSQVNLGKRLKILQCPLAS